MTAHSFLKDLPSRFQRDIDHWNRTGRCLRHFALDTPPRFCEQCGKDWKAVVDGREGRKRRRERFVLELAAGFRDVTVEVRLAPGVGWHDLREFVNEHPKMLFLRFIDGLDEVRAAAPSVKEGSS